MSERWDQEFERERAAAAVAEFARTNADGTPRHLHASWNDIKKWATEHGLELFSADTTFQGADGIGLDGSIYNTDLRLARVDRMMRRCSKRTCVLADHTKIGRTALARSGSLADVDIFITDSAAPRDALRRFARLGVKVITVTA